MAEEPKYYLGPFDRIVDFHFGNLLVIDGGVDVNVYDEAVAAELPVDQSMSLTVKVTGQVTHLIWGTSWEPGTTFKLVNESTIVGKGGAGGNASRYVSGSIGDAQNGAAGGNAIDLNGNDISVKNEEGYIFGGGGGGGGGGFAQGSSTPTLSYGSAFVSGGGGGGGPGGASTGGSGSVDFFGIDQAQAEARENPNAAQTLTDALGTVTSVPLGTYTETTSVLSTAGDIGGISGIAPVQGAGGVGSVITGSTDASGGDGGNGAADFAQAGQAGSDGAANGPDGIVTKLGGAAGGAGKAINLAGGSVIWISGNEPARVKGVVS